MSDRKLGSRSLSNLLFAACGVNRTKGPFGHRGITAASASNSQEIDVYVALEEGTYDTGIIAGNVYLWAASEGLACWFHNCDKVSLAKKLKLRRAQRVLFAQTIGHPKRGRGGNGDAARR